MKDLIDVHTHVYDYSGDVSVIRVAYNYDNFDRSDVVGVAPQNYKDYRFDLEQYMSRKIGVGEIGLDYYWVRDEDERKIQREVFQHQLSVAERNGGLVEIHCRDAYSDVISIMSSYNIRKAVFHFFSGSLDDYRKIIDRGWYISIPPRQSSARKRAIQYDQEHLLCETDSPYIVESPDQVIESYEFISKTLDIPIDRTIQMILDNYTEMIGD